MSKFNLSLSILIVITIVLIISCGRSSNFVISSNPNDNTNGSLIDSHPAQPRNSTFSGRVRFVINRTVSATFPGTVAAGDFNADGNADFAFGQIGAMTVCLGDGRGNLTNLVAVSFDEPGDGIGVPMTMKTGDFNNDGRTDLAVGYPMCTADNRHDNYPQPIDKHNIWIYWGGPDFAINPTRIRSLRSLTDICFIKLNNDNLYDIMAVGNNGSNMVHYQTTNREFIEGDRNFVPTYNNANSDLSKVLAGNLFDKTKDIFFVANTTDNVVFYSYIYDQYANSFNAPLGFWIKMPQRGQGLNLLDANNDGTSDLLLGFDSSEGLAIAYGIPITIGTKSFWKATDFQMVNIYGQGHAPLGTINQACSADFDNDGRLEVAVADLNNISIIKFGNSRNPNAEIIGQFTYPSRQKTGVGMLATADFNKDGKPDLVTTDIVGGRALCLINVTD